MKLRSKPTVEKCKSYPVSIFIAGNYELARFWAQQYCDEVGLCVTLTKTEYVYTNGIEHGVIIGLINNPQVPRTFEFITEKATDLAEFLLEKLIQKSYSIQTPEETITISYRISDVEKYRYEHDMQS